MAVCDVAPPTSVMNEAKRCSLKAMVSAGDKSWATTIRLSSFDFLAFFNAARPGWPSSSLTTRSTTCTTSNLRSRR